MRITDFERAIDGLTYPTTTETITSEYGARELQFQDGTERVDRVLDRFGSQTFASADEVRLTLYGALPQEAVGRKGYTDRDPPGLDEVDHVSF